MEFCQPNCGGVLQIVNQEAGILRDKITSEIRLGKHAADIARCCNARFGVSIVCLPNATFGSLCHKLGIIGP